MKTIANIGWKNEELIVQENLPVCAGLKVIRKNDPNYGLSDEEIQDRNEFIRCYLLRDFEPLLKIPIQVAEDDFFIPEHDVCSSEYTAFNTHDFQKRMRPFNRYAYAMKIILERVKDLAILYSVVSSRDGKEEIFRRFESLVEYHFRGRLLFLVRRYRYAYSDYGRIKLKQNIGEINRRILECKRIWEQFAPWDV